MQGLVSWTSWWQDAVRALSSVFPLALPFLWVTFHPLNQGMLALGFSMLSAFQPEIGTSATVSGL